MSTDWRTVRLGDVTDLYDGPHQTAPLTEDGPIVYLNVGDIRDGRIQLRLSGRISEETASTWSKRLAPQPGDIVFGYEATVGDAAMLPDTHRWCLGRRVGLLRVRPEQADARYLRTPGMVPDFRAS